MAAYMPMISMGMQAAGAAQSAVGGYYGARSRKSSLNFQANMSDINARLSELSAQSALLQGQREEQKSRLQTAELKSTQRTGMAANGIDLGEGSATQVLTSTDLMGQVDAETIKSNAVRNAWGYRTQAVNSQNEAIMARAGAKSISPGMSLATSLLGSAGSVSQSWYQFKQAGAFDSGTQTKASGPSPISGPAYAAMQSSAKPTNTSSWW